VYKRGIDRLGRFNAKLLRYILGGVLARNYTNALAGLSLCTSGAGFPSLQGTKSGCGLTFGVLEAIRNVTQAHLLAKYLFMPS
jgi:hypothetical protein